MLTTASKNPVANGSARASAWIGNTASPTAASRIRLSRSVASNHRSVAQTCTPNSRCRKIDEAPRPQPRSSTRMPAAAASPHSATRSTTGSSPHRWCPQRPTRGCMPTSVGSAHEPTSPSMSLQGSSNQPDPTGAARSARAASGRGARDRRRYTTVDAIPPQSAVGVNALKTNTPDVGTPFGDTRSVIDGNFGLSARLSRR
jgi:hypothetical protein